MKFINFVSYMDIVALSYIELKDGDMAVQPCNYPFEIDIGIASQSIADL